MRDRVRRTDFENGRTVEPINPNEVGPAVYRGPFHERQRALGASFYEDMGCLWTASFGDPVSEYGAVLECVGVWDESALIKLRFTGRDVLRALDRVTTRRVSALAPGRAAYGAVLTSDGRMLDEVTAFPCSDTEAYLFGNDERAPFLAHVETLCDRLDVSVENVTRSMPTLSIQGPGSYEALAGLVEADLGRLRWFDFFPEPVRVAGRRAMVARVCFSGELGYEVHLLDDDPVPVWDAVTEAGATPIGIDAVELLRVEAGLLIQDEDYVPGTTDPYDVSLDPFIDLASGHAFVGRDACVARAGAPPNRLVTLAFDGGTPPPARSTIVTPDGRPVGEVTSPQMSPRFGPVALAVVATDLASDGARVIAGEVPATVRSTPLDAASRARRTVDVGAVTAPGR